MKKRGEQQRHEIEVSFGRQRRMTELSRAARLRLYGWGSVVRSIIVSQGPGATTYSQQPFTRQRIDLETVHAMGMMMESFNQAEEIDNWLVPVRSQLPEAYRAATIRYIERGHAGHALSAIEQVRRYHVSTGKGQTNYYASLDRVLQHICAEILLKENPELKYE